MGEERRLRRVANDPINYLYPATSGDVLAITCRIEEIGESTVRLGYRIVEQRMEKEILQATTSVVAVDPSSNSIPIPHEVREALEYGIVDKVITKREMVRMGKNNKKKNIRAVE